MGKFEYLPEIISLVAIEYVVLIGVFTVLKISKKIPTEFFDKEFRDVTDSWIAKGDDASYANIILLAYRLLAFCWLGIVGTVLMFSLYPTGWHYYTNWNLILISFYFLSAFTASCLQYSGLSKYIRGDLVVGLGNVVGSCFGFVASSALMVTVLNFALLSPTPTFWNITQHLTQTVCILIEMSTNSIRVNPQEVILAVSWAFLYLTFIWPIVAEGLRQNFPYFFVETENKSAFIWYQVLFILTICFFGAICGIDKLKWKQIEHRCRVVTPIGEDATASPEIEVESTFAV